MRKLKKYKPTKLMAKSSHYDEQIMLSALLRNYAIPKERGQERNLN